MNSADALELRNQSKDTLKIAEMKRKSPELADERMTLEDFFLDPMQPMDGRFVAD